MIDKAKGDRLFRNNGMLYREMDEKMQELVTLMDIASGAENQFPLEPGEPEQTKVLQRESSLDTFKVAFAFAGARESENLLRKLIVTIEQLRKNDENSHLGDFTTDEVLELFRSYQSERDTMREKRQGFTHMDDEKVDLETNHDIWEELPFQRIMVEDRL